MWKGSSRSLFRTLVLENSKFLLFDVIFIRIICNSFKFKHIS